MTAPFLQYINEARVVRRPGDLQRYTYQEICEKVYLTFLTLSLLKNFSQTAGWVKQYANATLIYGDFSKVRGTANDLHNMLAVVDGEERIIDKLANKSQATALRQRTHVPTMAVKRYLRTFKDDYGFLTQLENALAISNADYKNLRRAISDFANLNNIRRKTTTTRLLQALRAKMSNTDVTKKAEEFSQKLKYELDNVVDAEASVDQSNMTAEELTAYRILVGPANIRRAKLAVEMAKQGKGLPAPVVSAYLPIMNMVDDIADGGFTYVRLLKSLHDRAKKSK